MEAPHGRLEGMSDTEWLAVPKGLRQLEARRDRYVEVHVWDGFETFRVSDHASAQTLNYIFGGNAAAN